MTSINRNQYSTEYLNGINEKFVEMDSAGNGDGKVDANEALIDLNIGSLLKGQGVEDTQKIMEASQCIPKAIEKYAGEDGEFTAQEWADFINGKEWGGVLDKWHSSQRKAELEMQWTDNTGITDGKTTKDEVKAGILNNLSANGHNFDTKFIEELIDSYAGKDGTFNLAEYKKMLNDEKYKEFKEKYNVTPWYEDKEA